jgi:hypothetical protein
VKLTDFEVMRVQELLVLRATEGLSDGEKTELARFDSDDIASFDVAAAMVAFSVQHREDMPDDVTARVLQNALSHHGKQRAAKDSSTAPALPSVAAVFTAQTIPAVVSTASVHKLTPKASSSQRSSSILAYSGWGFAAAAAGVAIWMFANKSDSETKRESAVSAAAVAAASDVISLPLLTEGALGGNVKWSASAQQGALSIVGLPSNVPTTERYQLWIFDRNRDARYPVDAGLFDASKGATQFNFAPRMKVEHVTQFMVTREAAHGAVVSERKAVIATTVVQP